MDNKVYAIESYFKQDDSGNIELDSNPSFMSELKNLTPSKSLTENDSQLDMYSYKFYGNERYWWLLMLYNDIIDPDSTGLIEVRGPSKTDLDSLLSKYYVRR